MSNDLFMGIDVSKGYADFCVLNSQKREVLKPFQLYDISQQHKALDEIVQKLVSDYQPDCIYAAVESTGGYEDHWLEALELMVTKYPIMYARLNPLGVSKHRQAEMREQITDKLSSKVIATYLISYHDRIIFNSSDPYKNHRIILSNINILTKQLVQQKNCLRQYLYLYFPEILPYCRNDLRPSVLTLLIKYPGSAKMAAFVNRKSTKPSYLTSEELLSLRQQCRQSIASPSNQVVDNIISETARMILNLLKRVDVLYAELRKILPKDKLEILMSMPGVGIKTAIVVQCVLGNVERFNNVHQMLGYLGLYPTHKESGDKKHKPKLSRKGNTLIRKHLYMAALSAVRHDPYLKTIYEKSVERGVCRRAALTKIMSKMMCMLYGMLKSNSYYDPKVDGVFREKYTKKPDQNVTALNEKLLKENAQIRDLSPISKRHDIFRKEQTLAIINNDSKSTLLSAAPPDFLSENILEDSPNLVKNFLDF